VEGKKGRKREREKERKRKRESVVLSCQHQCEEWRNRRRKMSVIMNRGQK